VNTQTEIPAGEPTIIMTRLYDAPRDLVWQATTEAKHVRRWWGGPGFSNPVCEMDVRPGGLWNHVMRFPDGKELHLAFVFIEVERPTRLVWQHRDYGQRKEGLPAVHTTITLDDFGGKTRWTMVARFLSMEDRDTAVSLGFSRPIEASSNSLVEYLKTM
jgi:uncharacterized protein YndB with AHSA1/START domain